MPAKAGIQYGVDSLESRSLDPGLRRGDESNFNKLLRLGVATERRNAVTLWGNKIRAIEKGGQLVPLKLVASDR